MILMCKTECELKAMGYDIARDITGYIARITKGNKVIIPKLLSFADAAFEWKSFYFVGNKQEVIRTSKNILDLV